MVVFVYRFFDIRKYIKLKVFTVRNVIAFVLLVAAAVLVYVDSLVVTGIQVILLVVLIIIKFEPIKTVADKIAGGLK